MDERRGDAIIGRDHPAGLLRAELDRATTSHGGFVLVTGEPGIGKTTLVTSAARRPGNAARWCSVPPAGIPTARPATGRGCRCCATCGAPPTTGHWPGSPRSRPSPPCSARPTPAGTRLTA
ncbi:ATP-binding protein [Micromonospora sp. M12]